MTKRFRNSMFAIMSSMMMLLMQPANSLSELSVMTAPRPNVHAVKSATLKTKKHTIQAVRKAKASTPVKPLIKTAKPASTKSLKSATTKVSTKKVAGKKQTSTTKKSVRTNRTAKKLSLRKVVPIKPMPLAQRKQITESFANGYADKVTPRDMVRAGAFSYFPLRGGVFRRKSQIKAVVVHSTETASPASAKDIVRSWNNSGANHAGTQFIVDRDGIIYMTVPDPTVGTFHVNSFITLEGVKNDNSIGIEIVRTGRQQYTKPQLASVSRLVHYLLDRYQVPQVFGHGEIQPTDRTDPVGFNWQAFDNDLDGLELSQAKFKAEQYRIAAAQKQQAKLAVLKKPLTSDAVLASAKKQIGPEKEQGPSIENRKVQQAIIQLRSQDRKQTSEKSRSRIVADAKHSTEKG